MHATDSDLLSCSLTNNILLILHCCQKLPPLPLISLVLFHKMTVIQLFDRYVIQSEYAVDACHSSSMKGSRPPHKQPSRGARSIFGCPSRGCQEHFQVDGCKFINIYSCLLNVVQAPCGSVSYHFSYGV